MVSTSIFKQPVPGPVWVETLNVRGDGQADLRFHGGVDKAVYAFGWDAYEWWQREVKDVTFLPGAFGENFTVDPLDEKKLFLGDRLKVGGCEWEVAEPRFPCFKLGLKFQRESIVKLFMTSGRPGVYFRVKREGEVAVGDCLEKVYEDPSRVSIDEFFRAKAGGYRDKPLLKKLLSVPSLSAEWREKFEEKLK